MTSPEPPLVATSLSRRYGRLEALVELDVTVEAGACVALIGANGSGKSTAVRTVAGLLEPSEGEVRVCGWDPHHEPEAERARGAIAVVPDNPLLYEDLTVRQHLELVALAHGVADDGLDERIDELTERLGLADRRDFVPSELSRGMRQKTQLACALVRPAALLLLDEPVVGLDPPSQRLLHEILVEAKGRGTGVLMTTHQLGFADGLADRALVLEEGRVIDEGSWSAVQGRAAERGWLR